MRLFSFHFSLLHRFSTLQIVIFHFSHIHYAIQFLNKLVHFAKPHMLYSLLPSQVDVAKSGISESDGEAIAHGGAGGGQAGVTVQVMKLVSFFFHFYRFSSLPIIILLFVLRFGISAFLTSND